MKTTLLIAAALVLMAVPLLGQDSTTAGQDDDNDGFDWGWLGLLGLLGLLPRRAEPDHVVEADRARVTTTTRP
jgi:MYXO-CTERM domain-containing protein